MLNIISKIKYAYETPTKIITYLALALTHIMGLAGFFIFFLTIIYQTKAGELNLASATAGGVLSVFAIAINILYYHLFVKKKKIFKNMMLTFSSMFIILSWIYGLLLRNEGLQIYSSIEGIMRIIWMIISRISFTYWIPIMLILVIYLISRQMRNFNFFFIALILCALAIPSINFDTLNQNILSETQYKVIQETLQKMFIFFTGAICYLHFNYLFFNHEYDKLTMIGASK